MTLDLIVIASIALSVLLFIGEAGWGGVVLDVVSRFTFGLFGLIAYACPFVIFFGTLLVLANRRDRAFAVRTISLLAFSLFLMTLFELIKTGGDGSGAASYLSSYREKNGGGLFGGLIAGGLYLGFGTLAAYIIDLVAMIVSLLFFFGRSFVKRARHRERNFRKRMELKSAERETREDLQAQKADRYRQIDRMRSEGRYGQGVSLNTELPADAASGGYSDEMNEITASSLEVREETLSAEMPKRAAAEDTMGELSSADGAEAAVSAADGTDVFTSAAGGTDTLSSAPGDVPMQGQDRSFTDSLPPLPPDEMQVINRSGQESGPADGMEAAAEEAPVFQEEGSLSAPAESVASSAPVSDPMEPEVSVSESMEPEVSASESMESEVSVSESKEPKFLDSEPLEPEASAPAPSKAESKSYVFPSVDLLKDAGPGTGDSDTSIRKLSETLQKTLRDFGVNARVTDYMAGPAVTRFEIEPETGVKVSKILNLSDDIKLNLAVPDIRIEAPIPGKAAIGIEVPNKHPKMVSFRELMVSKEWKTVKSKIAFAAGRDIAGNVVISDIAKMPHLLIAGATGSGKSVCINTIIMSILYAATPEEVRFIMIDPKIVELSVYNGIPHLLVPVVTDPKKAAGALQWAVTEMTNRYKRFADAAVRDMKSYNAKVKQGAIVEDGKPVTAVMPQIVVIVDELADLMMVAGKEVEAAICRLAQLARAAGIHLIIATQRPSADIITGLIKANMPSRIAFAVTSGIDSRVVLDMNGAEKLLGKGDMLYFPQGMPKPLRVQGAFVSDEEVGAVCDFIRTNNNEAVSKALSDQEKTVSDIEAHQEALSSDSTEIDGNGQGGFTDERDPFFEEAGAFLSEKGKASIGMLQRKFRIGFNRAARIIDQLEEAGIVGPELGTKPRSVLMKPEEFQAYLAAEKNSEDS